MDTIKEQLGDIFGQVCTRCGKNHAIEAPSQNCYQKQVEQLQNKIERLEELRKYAKHLSTCKFMTTLTTDTRCDCGYEQALKATNDRP